VGGKRIEFQLFNKEEILQAILQSPYSVVKCFHIEKGITIKEKFFKSNWETFSYLEKITPSDKNDGIIIASPESLVISDIKLFMDGRLLKFYAFISHDKNKIPENIDFFYRNNGKTEFLNQPYFLFSFPENTKKVSIRKNNCAAVFQRNSNANEVAENIKLIEDAGYQITKWKTLNSPENGKFLISLSDWLSNDKTIDTVALFFRVLPRTLSELEILTGLNILTREDLIIEIFETRADGTSGKLKLANAMIEREKTIFRKKVKGLSRIKGGIGLKGPGETKEEERKRILKNKEKSVRKALKNESERIGLQKKYRMKRNIPTVAIVGYTNAGKSTLFNALLNEKCVEESSSFFSSIDPKIKKLHLFKKEIFLIDTVGFIENMSKDIIDAYKSTFLEIVDTSLIIHIVDPTTSMWRNKKNYIEKLLFDNGVDKEKIMTLFSKKDLVKIKHPVKNGFYYSALKKEDIRLVKNTIYVSVFTENEPSL
jgi:GTP-binding protein HflX